ncbi:MAG: hypothetical protein K2X75_05180 [Burkholderiaceae bacterium]|jgi:hypothetical protein|nr:hypothetical protein [Burkholderiaceae bacterium]
MSVGCGVRDAPEDSLCATTFTSDRCSFVESEKICLDLRFLSRTFDLEGFSSAFPAMSGFEIDFLDPFDEPFSATVFAAIFS